MILFQHPPRRWRALFLLAFALVIVSGVDSAAFDFPAAGWHRGDAAFAQENSRAALQKALASANPNIELDIIDFVDARGRVTVLPTHIARGSLLLYGEAAGENIGIVL